MSYTFSYLKFLCRNYGLRFLRLLRHFRIISLDDGYYIVPKSILDWIMGLFFYVIDLLLLSDIYELGSGCLKVNTRLLSQDEIELAKSIYGDTIRLELVRMDANAWIATRRFRITYVSMFTINSYHEISDQILIHELAHVLQFQRYGAVYIYFALKAQHSEEAYDYGGTLGLLKAKKEGRMIKYFNLEQQASIVQHYFVVKNQSHTSSAVVDLYKYYVDQIKTATRQ